MPTEEMILEALRNVYDPEIGLNIVDLGLVYGVEITPGKVHVRMTLTTPGCPLHDTLSEGVRQALSIFKGVEEVEVELVWDPPWTPEAMSAEAKEALGWL